MDVVLIAAAGVLAPFVVFAIWRRIPPDPDMRSWLAHWASRLRLGRKTDAESEAQVDRFERDRTRMVSPILAEPPHERVSDEPEKKDWVRGVTHTVPIRRLAVSAAPRAAVKRANQTSRSASNGRPDPQWPALDTTNGYIRPSSQEACPRCQESASRGATYCHACGRRLASDATSVPTEQGPALAEGAEQAPARAEAADQPPKKVARKGAKKGVGSHSRTSPRLGRSSLP